MVRSLTFSNLHYGVPECLCKVSVGASSEMFQLVPTRDAHHDNVRVRLSPDGGEKIALASYFR